MERIKPQEQQNMFDIALQGYGSIEGVIDLMQDNKLTTLGGTISVYDTYDITKQPLNRNIKNFYEERNVKPATGVTQANLEIYKELTLEGIGVMIIEDDFIVRPSEITEELG